MIYDSGAMRRMPIHLVLGVALLVVFSIFVVLAVRTVPAREGEDGIVERGTVARLVTSDVRRPTERASQPFDDPTAPSPAPRPSGPVPHYRYKIVRTYPHDRRCFTQGLVYEDGFVYEGTGLYGQSALYKRDLQTGKTVNMLLCRTSTSGRHRLFGDRLISSRGNPGRLRHAKDVNPCEFKYRGGWEPHGSSV
jgi:hypothetical protein